MKARGLVRVGRRVYLLVLVAAAVVVLVVRRNDLTDLVSGARIAMLAAALVGTSVLLVFNSALWVASLRMLNQPITLRQALAATARALPARYVPTGVGFPVARAALVRSATGLSPATLAAAAVFEMSMSVGVAAASGLAVLGAAGALPGGWAWALVLPLVALPATCPPVGGRLLAKLAARRAASVDIAVSWAGWVRLLVAAGAYWGWASAMFALHLAAFGPADPIGAFEAAGAFMVSWAVGFIAVFAPQGVGVAEAGLVALLTPAGADAVTLGVIFGGYRLLLLIRDLVVAVSVETALRRSRKRTDRPES